MENCFNNQNKQIMSNFILQGFFNYIFDFGLKFNNPIPTDANLSIVKMWFFEKVQ